MKPAKRHLTHRRGMDFEYSFRPKVKGGDFIDMTGWTVVSQIFDREDNLLYTLNTTISPDQTGNSKGLVTLSYDNLGVVNDPDVCLWEIRMTSPAGKEDTYIEGKFHFTSRTD